jgi:hypothetical protein
MHAKDHEAFQDRVEVRIAGNEGRIRLPGMMLPLVQGGDDGWLELRDLKLTDDAITGSAAVNLMSRPKVHIDRNTGTIRISGRAGSYSGTCETMPS